jgi:hypothetical protein
LVGVTEPVLTDWRLKRRRRKKNTRAERAAERVRSLSARGDSEAIRGGERPPGRSILMYTVNAPERMHIDQNGPCHFVPPATTANGSSSTHCGGSVGRRMGSLSTWHLKRHVSTQRNRPRSPPREYDRLAPPPLDLSISISVSDSGFFTSCCWGISRRRWDLPTGSSGRVNGNGYTL